jgi:hypothetical protein
VSTQTCIYSVPKESEMSEEGSGVRLHSRKHISTDKLQVPTDKAISLPWGPSHVPKTLRVLAEKMDNSLQDRSNEADQRDS